MRRSRALILALTSSGHIRYLITALLLDVLALALVYCKQQRSIDVIADVLRAVTQ